MIELKKFVCVFILNLLSDTNSDISLQNEFLNKLGLNRNLRSPQRRLFGGQMVEDMVQFPFMVWLTLNVQPKQITTLTSRNAFCGGSIISNRFILTASHCITVCAHWACQEDKFCSLCETSKPETVRVMSGGNSPRKFQTISLVKKLYPHPDFKYTDEEHQCLARSDIGLVELKKPLHFNSVVNKMKLPKPIPLGVVNLQKTKINRLAKQKKFCTLLGFGDTMNNDKTSNSKRTLKFTKIQLIDTKECLGHLKIGNKDLTQYKNKGLCTDTTVCSYNQERKEGICFGDSGSPLVCGGEQIGVVSWSPGGKTHCVGNRMPDIYTRVDVHVPWIQSVMRGKEKKLKKNGKKVNEKTPKAIGNKTKYNRSKTKEKKANENKPKTKEKKNITEAKINKNRIKVKGKQEQTQDNRKEGKGKETQDRRKEGKGEEKRENRKEEQIQDRRKEGKGEEIQGRRKEDKGEEIQNRRKEGKGEEIQDRRKEGKGEEIQGRRKEDKGKEIQGRRKEGKGEEIQDRRKEDKGEEIQDRRKEGKGEEIEERRKEGKGEEIQGRRKEGKGEETRENRKEEQIQDRRKYGKREEIQGRRKEDKVEEILDRRKEGKGEEIQDRRKEGKGEEIEERKKEETEYSQKEGERK